MEVTKLLRLIKDDITQLDAITGEFDGVAMPLPEEIEVAFVRSKALLRELELLHKLAEQHEKSLKTGHSSEENRFEVPHHEVSEPLPATTVTQKINDHEAASSLRVVFPDHVPEENVQIEMPIMVSQKAGEKYREETPEIVPEVSLKIVESHAEPAAEESSEHIETITEPDITQENPHAEEATDVRTPTVTDSADHQTEMIAEEFTAVRKTLNETFGEQHQMVNDYLTPEKDETVYRLTPLQSMWEGIGINDRFLFIRELFSNNSVRFESTVDEIDRLESIQDAVNYLKLNFKWNKTEASQKFLVLVKRRFTK